MGKKEGTGEVIFTFEKVLTVTSIPAVVEVAPPKATSASTKPVVPGQAPVTPVLPTCGSFSCPTSTVAKSARFRCSSSTCSAADCCAPLPQCATHQCPIDMKAKDASTPCTGMICVDPDCCVEPPKRAPCVAGTTFNAPTGSAPCSVCTDSSTCSLGIEQVCTATTDTR